MSRAAYLSAGGDPFLADFTLQLWKNNWRDEIDTMYIGYNNHSEVPTEVAHEFVRAWENDPKVRVIYTPHGIGNGNPITQMLLNSKEDSLLLLEDDSYVFTPGVVDQWFTNLEWGENVVIGSPRYSVGEVADAAKKKYNLDYSGVGDKGFGWWPSFFLCKRADLLKTDLDFGSKKYPKGEYFKELDHTFENDDYTDTFTWASIQLRYLGLTEYAIPQNHTHPTDFEKPGKLYAQEHDNHEIKYLHGGSLSSGLGGYLNRKLPPVETEFEKKDIETRVAFWKIVSDCSDFNDKKGKYKSYYQACIEALIQGAKLNPQRIQNKYNGYRRLIHV